jgi:aminomethyltransferase
MTTLKHTALHAWHENNGANLVAFGDYHMPMWYDGVKSEHLAVLNSAGLFDTSHMAVVTVKGTGAFDLLNKCFTRDLSACVGKDNNPISDGRCVYGAFLNQEGRCIDDAITYKIQDNDFVVVINAGMGSAIAGHLKENCGDLDAEVTDLTDKVGKFDIQGPTSVKIMEQVIQDPDTAFEKFFYFSFKGHFDPESPITDQMRLKDGTPFMLSRSGYTGEVGFEIFIQPEHTEKAWTAIVEAGKDLGITPCGLGARDSLRTGANLPLSHQDIGNWTYINHPWPFALPYTADGSDFTKSFIGSEVIKAAAETADNTYTFVGNDLRKIDAHDAKVIDINGNEIGTVLTCATDMGIGKVDGKIFSVASPEKPDNFKAKGLCCGFLKVNTKLSAGDVVEVKDAKRILKVNIIPDVRPDRTARRALKNFR